MFPDGRWATFSRPSVVRASLTFRRVQPFDST
jgi:hypothetical protein